MPSPKPPTGRGKKTKHEVEQEFLKIEEEITEAKEARTPKAEEMVKQREADVRQAVQDVSVEGVVQKVTGVGIEISKFLSHLSDTLRQEVNLLHQVREAVALERKELERLHKIDIGLTALEQLVLDYEAKKAAFETEAASREAQWSEQEQQREWEQKEYDENLKRQRQREVEEYEYKKGIERKKAQDRYEEEQRLLDKKNKDKQEALEKSWQQREAALKEKEVEFSRLSKEVDDFPAKLNTEVEIAVAEALKGAKQRHEQELALLKKDMEAERRVADLQIKSLTETVTAQSARIDSLQKQLDDAKRQVQEIAVKAIEGASGATALSHINKIAMEQAKTRTQP